MSDNATQDKIWTPANIVTIVRICGVPIFVAALLSPWPQWFPFELNSDLVQPLVAAIIFAILACTDGVDGYLARSRNEVTTFGKFIDPLADKILVAAALLALVELGVLPSWVALIILAREFIVSGLRMIAAAKGEVVAASWYGKAKTVTQIIAILLFLMKEFMVPDGTDPLSSPLWVAAWAVMIVAVILTIVSMVDYFYKCRSVLGFKVGDEDSQPSLPQAAINNLKQGSWTVATAESLTGGLICSELTAIPGSSSVVKGGIVSYVNEVKHGVLGVDENTLETEGAVSEQTALQMAIGAREKLGSTFAVSVTGIAGPTGAEPGKPVGTVWMGIATPAGTEARCFCFKGDRAAVRQQTVDEALKVIAGLSA